MNLGDLIRQAAEANFIDGVFNYCDRWCERCPLTSRCLVYHQEQANKPTADEPDSENQAFWDRLTDSMRSAAVVLSQIAEERGVDLNVNNPTTDDAEVAMQERLEQEPLPRLAHQYAEKVDQWFQAATDDFEAKGDELRSIEEMDLDGSDPVAEANDIADCVEIVRWYQYQIAVKLMRAYSGITRAMNLQLPADLKLDELKEELLSKSIPAEDLQGIDDLFDGEGDLHDDDLDNPNTSDDASDSFDALQTTADATESDLAASSDHEVDVNNDDPFAGIGDEDDPEFEYAMQIAELNDSDGSAKVALIGIDRSIAAWTRLRPHLPDRADELLDILVMLDRLRRATESQFPEAREFKRPGFDD